MMKNRFSLLSALLYLSFAVACGSCYRMPTDDDFSVVPTTNNPAITCEKPQQVMTKLGY